jgi:hypothetical protein
MSDKPMSMDRFATELQNLSEATYRVTVTLLQRAIKNGHDPEILQAIMETVRERSARRLASLSIGSPFDCLPLEDAA